MNSFNYETCEMFARRTTCVRHFHRTIFGEFWVYIYIESWCSQLTHACACFGGWSGAMLPMGRDSNGIPPVRRTPDGVLASCINGIFDDALSLHNISSRSICKQNRKLNHIDQCALQFKSIKSLNLSFNMHVEMRAMMGAEGRVEVRNWKM